MHVLVMFGNGGGVLFMSFYTIVSMFACVTYIACITQVTLEVKLHTGYLQSGLCFYHIQFLFNFSAGKHRLDGGVNF